MLVRELIEHLLSIEDKEQPVIFSLAGDPETTFRIDDVYPTEYEDVAGHITPIVSVEGTKLAEAEMPWMF